MTSLDPQIKPDRPLSPDSALDNDRLSRKPYAEAVVSAIRKVSSSAGFTLSVEGAWGSGKTSALAMIEELLRREDESRRPVVVHFNPWLIGDRDALLRQFLARLAGAIKLSDPAKDGKKVAREIKAYAKALDLVKLIPGAEPWASLIKSVFESVGETAGSISEYKTPDIEQYKQRVEHVLLKFPRPIVVFIDDIDRLFPAEVFEMVRIIKAVGDLPHVGYVLAWDPSYVSTALASLHVPQSVTYLDKLVQVRMPLPGLSASAKRRLFNEELAGMDPDAQAPRFKDDKNRLSTLYFSGLRELIEQPRDVIRLFNTLRVIEPALRGEITFGDIVGLAALMVKAAPVFELLRKNPRYFVGHLPSDRSLLVESKQLVANGAEEVKTAIQACPLPGDAKRLLHALFPMVAAAENSFPLSSASSTKGHLASPARLMIALQLGVSPSDASMNLARSYLQHQDKRDAIARDLHTENWRDFFELLGDVAESLGGELISDLEDLCVCVAALVDKNPFPTWARNVVVFSPPLEDMAMRAINMAVQAVDTSRAGMIAQTLAECSNALSVAAELLERSYMPDRNDRQPPVLAPESSRESTLSAFSGNVLKLSTGNGLFGLLNPRRILWTLGRLRPSDCPAVFQAIKAADPDLDRFALEFLSNGWDTVKGQLYKLPQEITLLAAYCSVEEFNAHAKARIGDASLTNEARVAWRCVVEEKALYGIDGSEAVRH